MSNKVVIERIFEASVQRVWDAWTKPVEAAKWWGPRHFTAPHMKIDLRVGGAYLFCMHGEAGLPLEMVGKDFWSTGTYKEIVPLKKLVCTDSFADQEGSIVDPQVYGMPEGAPREMEVTVTFEDLGNDTIKMIVRHVGMPAGLMQNQMVEGWNQSFDKLAESLK